MSRFQQSGLGVFSKAIAPGLMWRSLPEVVVLLQAVQEGWHQAPVMVGSTCQAIRHAELSFAEVSCLGEAWRTFLQEACVCL